MSFRIALSQVNSTVGDFEGNKQKIIMSIRRAKEKAAKLVIFPELVITGYPPRDLLHNSEFLYRNREVLEEITKVTEGIAVIAGFVDFYKGETVRNQHDVSLSFFQSKLVLHNTACLIQNCKVLGKVYKVHLPNYDIFDEKRYFSPGKESPIFEIEGEKIGINICEDIWFDEGPTEEQVAKGANFIINISASPFYAGKREIRRNILSQKARKNGVPIVYVNMVGGQDEMIFDGSSYVIDREGRLLKKGKSFEEDFLIIDSFEGDEIAYDENTNRNVFDALVLGTKDYVRKNGFRKAVIGLSGGVDSALTTVIACEALGCENILALLLPGPYSTKESLDDGLKLVHNLGIEHRVIEINRIYQEYLNSLSKHFKELQMDTTEENIQARIRGNILMAFSNKFHSIVLGTGNKSELAVGYSTLYGDMVGGLAVISDVPKTMVYELALHYNEIKQKKVIPDEILLKPPSAELRPNQKDTDELPEYKILDEILDMYIEREFGFDEIIKSGFDKSIVLNMIKRIKLSEFKRKQAPIGLKITPKSFGSGRRMPITNLFEK